MKITAIYPGTFDPITHGHNDMVDRALVLFDHLIVAVASGHHKNTVLSCEERVSLTKTVLQNKKNITVVSFEGLLIDLAHQHNAKAIVRGLRAVSDFDYEFQLAGMNRHLAPDIETIFLRPSEQLSYISSTLVKEIAALNGDISNFVHPAVAKALSKTRAHF